MLHRCSKVFYLVGVLLRVGIDQRREAGKTVWKNCASATKSSRKPQMTRSSPSMNKEKSCPSAALLSGFSDIVFLTWSDNRSTEYIRAASKSSLSSLLASTKKTTSTSIPESFAT